MEHNTKFNQERVPFLFPEFHVIYKLLSSAPHFRYGCCETVFKGFEIYIVEQWCLDREISSIITSYTGNPDNILHAIKIYLPLNPQFWPPELKNYLSSIVDSSSLQYVPDLGYLFVTNLSQLPFSSSNLNLIHVDGGDIRTVWHNFTNNLNLRRLNCGARSGVMLNKPSSASVDKFLQLYKITKKTVKTNASKNSKSGVDSGGNSTDTNHLFRMTSNNVVDSTALNNNQLAFTDNEINNEYLDNTLTAPPKSLSTMSKKRDNTMAENQQQSVPMLYHPTYTVIELVIYIVQVSLSFFNLLEHKYIDGFYCHKTQQALQRWQKIYGSVYFPALLQSRGLTPNVLSALISLVLTCFYKFIVEDCMPPTGAADPFTEPSLISSAIYHFQKKISSKKSKYGSLGTSSANYSYAYYYGGNTSHHTHGNNYYSNTNNNGGAAPYIFYLDIPLINKLFEVSNSDSKNDFTQLKKVVKSTVKDITKLRKNNSYHLASTEMLTTDLNDLVQTINNCSSTFSNSNGITASLNSHYHNIHHIHHGFHNHLHDADANSNNNSGTNTPSSQHTDHHGSYGIANATVNGVALSMGINHSNGNNDYDTNAQFNTNNDSNNANTTNMNINSNTMNAKVKGSILGWLWNEKDTNGKLKFYYHDFVSYDYNRDYDDDLDYYYALKLKDSKHPENNNDIPQYRMIITTFYKNVYGEKSFGFKKYLENNMDNDSSSVYNRAMNNINFRSISGNKNAGSGTQKHNNNNNNNELNSTNMFKDNSHTFGVYDLKKHGGIDGEYYNGYNYKDKNNQHADDELDGIIPKNSEDNESNISSYNKETSPFDEWFFKEYNRRYSSSDIELEEKQADKIKTRRNSLSLIQDHLEKWNLVTLSGVRMALELKRLNRDTEQELLPTTAINTVSNNTNETPAFYADPDEEFAALKTKVVSLEKNLPVLKRSLDILEARFQDDVENKSSIYKNMKNTIESTISKYNYDLRMLERKIRNVKDNMEQFDIKITGIERTLIEFAKYEGHEK
ncbi:uncharacterized protein SCODWIG_01527 [Saccharomycodes ludwigii]|uniref:STB6-like N-terminal domain-containing protein n=1 Tax=Saccharomycodes ludwigii TaxID=36035 RepID=A0A376B4Z7_9ASCO|nr:uncharacterized protein SCODWIG_01527 [Saccharomycodes ludwigii]